MVTTVRQRVLEYIRTHRLATAGEIGQALHLTDANVRHHMSILKEQGLVEVSGERPPQGKGRPAQLYALSQQIAGHNLAGLANALLEEFESVAGPQERQALLERLAQRLADQAAGGPSKTPAAAKAGDHLTRRLYSAIQSLNQFHYQARWEAHRDAPRVILGHCPYAALLKDHPEICLLDAQLIQTLLGAPVDQIAKLAKDERGAKYCMFKLRQAGP